MYAAKKRKIKRWIHITFICGRKKNPIESKQNRKYEAKTTTKSRNKMPRKKQRKKIQKFIAFGKEVRKT